MTRTILLLLAAIYLANGVIFAISISMKNDDWSGFLAFVLSWPKWAFFMDEQ